MASSTIGDGKRSTKRATTSFLSPSDRARGKRKGAWGRGGGSCSGPTKEEKKENVPPKEKEVPFKKGRRIIFTTKRRGKIIFCREIKKSLVGKKGSLLFAKEKKVPPTSLGGGRKKKKKAFRSSSLGKVMRVKKEVLPLRKAFPLKGGSALFLPWRMAAFLTGGEKKEKEKPSQGEAKIPLGKDSFQKNESLK